MTIAVVAKQQTLLKHNLLPLLRSFDRHPLWNQRPHRRHGVQLQQHRVVPAQIQIQVSSLFACNNTVHPLVRSVRRAAPPVDTPRKYLSASDPRTTAKILSTLCLFFPSLSDAFRCGLDIGTCNGLQSQPTLTYFPFSSSVAKERLNSLFGFSLVVLVTTGCSNSVQTSLAWSQSKMHQRLRERDLSTLQRWKKKSLHLLFLQRVTAAIVP